MPETRTTSSTGGQKGTKLARFDLVPAGPHRELAEHYGRGARKYADHQWRNGYEWSKSISALERHFTDFKAGLDYDVCSNHPEECAFFYPDGFKSPDGDDLSDQPFVAEEPDTCFNHTGSHHMAAVAWHSYLLLEFKDTYPEHDDRYKPELKGLPNGWEDLGYTTIDESQIFYSDRAREAISGDLLFQTVPSSFGTHDYPGHVDISIADVNHDFLRVLFGRPVLTRFVCGADGIEDLENPLPPADLSRWVSDYDADYGYVNEYRDFLRKHAPAIDAVGDVL